VWLARDERIADVRLAFGGVGPAPVRARAAEDALRGQPPSAEALERAATMAAGAIEPAGDAFASAAYRKLLARVLARRALTRAAAGGTAP
jgi:CO/xanthine dehydrogenase FAD-binding subunit